MARFYFHATDSRELVRDPAGDEVVRADELLSRAHLVARRIMAVRRSQPDWRSWMVVVIDEHGSMTLVDEAARIGQGTAAAGIAGGWM